MPPQEQETIPTEDVVTSTPSFKIVMKALQLPIVNDAVSAASKLHTEATAYPYVNEVETIIGGLFTRAEDTITPCVSASITSTVAQLDDLVCTGLDQFTAKVPALKLPTGELAAATTGVVFNLVTTVANFLSGFKFVQLFLSFVIIFLGIVIKGLVAILGLDEATATSTSLIGVLKVAKCMLEDVKNLEEVLQALNGCEDKSEEEICSTKRNLLMNLMRKQVFQQDLIECPELDLYDPTQFAVVGLSSFEQLCIPSGEDGQELGAWYLKPKGLKSDASKIVLYNHGVTDTRVGLYNVLLENGFSILTYDYRDFGDSTCIKEVTEKSWMVDCRSALAWLRQKEGKEAKILVWGHSMGTGISCRSIAQEFVEKNGEDTGVAGVVLESPYNNFASEVNEVLKSAALRTFFVRKALEAICQSTGNAHLETLVEDLKIPFESDRWIKKIDCPIMILHAEDDPLIPFALGNKLFEAAQAGGRDVEFHKFTPTTDGPDPIGHSGIYQCEKLPVLVKKFYNKLDK